MKKSKSTLSYGDSYVQNKNFAPFSYLNSFFDENELDVNEVVLELMIRHISIFGEEIRLHFSNLEDFQKYCRFCKQHFWNVSEICLHKIIQEQFIDLVNDGNARWKCEKLI